MPGGGAMCHYGQFREMNEDPTHVAMDETVASAIATAACRGARYACIHCGTAVAVISVFCGEACRDECLAQCGAGSTVGT